MNKFELAKTAEFYRYKMKRLNHNEPIQMEVMLRLCKVFHCDIDDLMKVVKE